MERDVDCGAVYDEKRRELIARVRSLTPAELALTVPATPAWSVQDVLAHVVGITADLNANRFGSGSPDEWTAAQVDSRRGRSVEQLAAEWDAETPLFVAGLALFGYEFGSHYVGDLLQHAADVGEALGLAPLDQDEALLVGLDHYLATFGDALEAARVGSVTVRAGGPERRWGAGPVVASIDADPYELFRCLGGRRRDAEVRALHWTGPADVVDLVVPLVDAYRSTDDAP